MDIMKLIGDKLEKGDILKNLTSSDIDSDKVRDAARLSIPAMIKGLEQNAKSSNGREALESALEDHSGEKLDDLEGFVKETDKSEGEKILSHIFGERRGRVETNIAKETGLEVSEVTEIMQKLAPVVLGFLGKKKSDTKSGVLGILENILTENKGLMGLSEKLLGKDSDGTIPTEIGDILGGLFKGK